MLKNTSLKNVFIRFVFSLGLYFIGFYFLLFSDSPSRVLESVITSLFCTIVPWFLEYLIDKRKKYKN